MQQVDLPPRNPTPALGVGINIGSRWSTKYQVPTPKYNVKLNPNPTPTSTPTPRPYPIVGVPCLLVIIFSIFTPTPADSPIVSSFPIIFQKSLYLY